eukprot:5769311-Prymnesium_polylepis.1
MGHVATYVGLVALAKLKRLRKLRWVHVRMDQLLVASVEGTEHHDAGALKLLLAGRNELNRLALRQVEHARNIAPK